MALAMEVPTLCPVKNPETKISYKIKNQEITQKRTMLHIQRKKKSDWYYHLECEFCLFGLVGNSNKGKERKSQKELQMKNISLSQRQRERERD